jgi:hypothetical protein
MMSPHTACKLWECYEVLADYSQVLEALGRQDPSLTHILMTTREELAPNER